MAASLVMHLILTSSLSLAWTLAAMRLFRLKQAGIRALLYAVAALAPVVGFVSHLLIPHECYGLLGTGSHLACIAGSWMGRAGTIVAAVATAGVVSQTLASWAVQHRVLRKAESIDGVDWTDSRVPDRVWAAVGAACAHAGIEMPRVMVPDRPGILCTVGIVHPVILISREFCENLDEAEISAAMAHEAAHIARYDNGIGLGALLMRALAFYSPAVYLAIEGYMRERERAADDYAARLTNDPLALASTIVKVAKASSHPSPFAAARLTSADLVIERVERLLDSHGRGSVGVGADLAKAIISGLGVAAIVFALC